MFTFTHLSTFGTLQWQQKKCPYCCTALRPYPLFSKCSQRSSHLCLLCSEPRAFNSQAIYSRQHSSEGLLSGLVVRKYSQDNSNDPDVWLSDRFFSKSALQPSLLLEYLPLVLDTSQSNGCHLQGIVFCQIPFKNSPTKHFVSMKKKQAFSFNLSMLLSNQARTSLFWWITTPALIGGILFIPLPQKGPHNRYMFIRLGRSVPILDSSTNMV